MDEVTSNIRRNLDMILLPGVTPVHCHCFWVSSLATNLYAFVDICQKPAVSCVNRKQRKSERHWFYAIATSLGCNVELNVLPDFVYEEGSSWQLSDRFSKPGNVHRLEHQPWLKILSPFSKKLMGRTSSVCKVSGLLFVVICRYILTNSYPRHWSRSA